MGDTKRTRDMTFSSEKTVVQRWFGGEQLDHSPGAVRMDFMKSGRAPLLLNHDMRQVVGVIESASIGGDRIGHATARFGRAATAEEALQNVDDQILMNTSVGYRVHEMVLASSKEGEETYRITDWEPYEVSLVAVPADPLVGVGRSTDPPDPPDNPATEQVETEARQVRASSVLEVVKAKPAKGRDMENTEASAGTSAEVRTSGGGNTAGEMEAGRVLAIRNMCEGCNIDDGIRSMFVSSGMSVDVASNEILAIVKKRQADAPKTAIGMSASDAQRFSFGRALIAASTGNWKDAGFELEASRAVYNKTGKPIEANRFMVPYEVQTLPRASLGGMNGQRDLTVASASGGGYLVATQNVSFIELLRNRTVAYRLGAQRLPGLVGNVTIPKQTGAATAVWLANEASTATESAQTFGQLALAPKTVGAYVEISRQLLLQSAPAAEQIAMSDVANVAAIAIDLAALSGSGAGGQPTGVVNTGGIGAFTGTSLAAAGLLDAQSDVLSSNVVWVAPGYVTTAAVAALLMARPELPSTGTTRMWKGSMLTGSIFDVPALASAQMSAATMLFGDWDKLVIGEWGALEIETNPYANFQAGIIGIRALITIDVGVRYAGAFSYSSSIT